MNITNDAEWKAARLKGIGASECSAIIGRNPYMSNVDLWEIKTGRRTAADISNKACVQYGHEAEGPLRELFALDYPQFEVTYGGAYDLVCNPDHPFILATLDGRLKEKATGRLGVYEGKTTEILRSMQREKWNDRIPDNYFCQVLHQLLATGWDFVYLNAQLKRIWDDEPRCEVRRYRIGRSDVQADLDYLLAAEIDFWRYVEADKRPPMILPPLNYED